MDLITKTPVQQEEFKIVLKKEPVKGFMKKWLPPPKKKITNKLAINKILAYSPKKKAANKIAEYSTL
jgi:hypothetical protein